MGLRTILSIYDDDCNKRLLNVICKSIYAGSRFGEDVIVDFQDERTFTIGELQFSTSQNSEGLWEFRHIDGK